MVGAFGELEMYGQRMFEGFSLSDFEAYLPEKWGSNMFTLPRMKVKDKLAWLGKAITQELMPSGFSLVMHLSDDHPSLWNKKKVDAQWLFFSRDEVAQKDLAEIIDTERTLAATLADPTPLYRHIFAGISVSQDRLELGIRLHYDAWVDRRNLTTILRGNEGQSRFDAFRSELPTDWEIGLVGSEMISPRDLTPDRLTDLLSVFEKNKGWIFLGVRLPRDNVVELGPDVLPVIVDSFKKLLPVYRFVAWSPENDAVSMNNLVADHRRELLAHHAERDKERIEREARRLAEEQERVQLRKEVEDRIQKEQEWRSRERAFRRVIAQKKEEEEKAALARHNEQIKNLSISPDHGPDKKQSAVLEPNVAPEFNKKVDSGSDKRGQRSNRRSRSFDVKPRSAPEHSKPSVSQTSEERKADIRVGDGVIVRRGFLKNKFGIVHAVEGKDLKVAFGALTSRVPRGDVEGRGPAPERKRKEKG